MTTNTGVGARLARKEDRRHLRGRGEFVADIHRPGTLEVAFVRSPVAHARINGVRSPEGARVYTARDLADVKPILARSALPRLFALVEAALDHLPLPRMVGALERQD